MVDTNTGAIIGSVLQNIILPEIFAIIRAHHNATGNLPTDAEVIAALQLDADRVISVGEAFLTSKGVPNVATPLLEP